MLYVWRRSFKDESEKKVFKLEVIKRVLSGEAKSSVSIEYNIELFQIRLWIKKYEEKV
ncbi:MAG: helix-turn-helix domain-containing protein [Coprobacillus sp.]|nr:helix-turn-helix domain-containing protein [Coprobacillus sp.]